MGYQYTYGFTEEEEAYRDACLRWPYQGTEVRAFSFGADCSEQVYAECFVMWLQVNQ